MKRLNVLLVSALAIMGVTAAYIDESHLGAHAVNSMKAGQTIALERLPDPLSNVQPTIERKAMQMAMPVSMAPAAKPPGATMSKVFQQGEITQENVAVGTANVETLTVKYSVGIVANEPFVSGAIKWSAVEDSESELPYTLLILLKLKSPNGGFGFIKLYPDIPEANTGFGYEVTGHVEWNNMVCGFPPEGNNGCYYQEPDARKLITTGRITDFDVSW